MRALRYAVIACATALAACVTLLPEAEPEQQYRLRVETASAPARATPGKIVQLAPGDFVRMSSGDQIMTVTDGEVAAIAGVRWAAPAAIMFDEELVRAFNAEPAVQLFRRAGAGADQLLRIEVQTFEARYLNGREAAPTVIVEARMILREVGGDGILTELFSAEVPAADNRVSAIVRAFDAASGEVISQIVSATAQAEL